MRRKSLFLVMALALVALPIASVASAAGWMVSGFGGATVPTGDFADENKADAQTGWQAGGAVDYLFNDMWTFGVDGSWNQNTHGFEGKTETITDPGSGNTIDVHGDEDRFKTWQVGAHAKYMIPMEGSPIHPFALLGLGVYNTKEDWTYTVTPVSPSGTAFTTSGSEKFDSKFGGKLGLGANWMANEMWGIGVEADYNFISEDKDKTGFDSAQYLGVKGVVSLKIPMAK